MRLLILALSEQPVTDPADPSLLPSHDFQAWHYGVIAVVSIAAIAIVGVLR